MFDDRFRELLPRIYDLGKGPRHWGELLEDIGQFLGGTAISLATHDFRHNLGAIYVARGYNQKYIDSYADDHAHHNVWLAREGDYRPTGKIHLGEQLVSEDHLLESKFYRKWLQPQNLHHRLCAVLSRAGSIAVFLEVMRSRSAGRFESKDVERCRMLLPHLQCMLHVHDRMVGLEMERDAAFDVLDHLHWGVVLVDDHGGRIAVNRRAEAILSAGDGLIAHGDSVRAVLPDETVQLNRLLKKALNGADSPGTGDTLSITRPSKEHPLEVRVIPVRAMSDTLVHRAQAAIFVSDPETGPDSDEQHLRQLYSLTVVEARLAAWLSKGKTIEQAATAMGVTVNTARAYLKRIYSKTGVRRQSELIRLLLLGLAVLSRSPARTAK